jgi:hypothetical protein
MVWGGEQLLAIMKIYYRCCGFGSRSAKMTHKNKKTDNKFNLLKYCMFSVEDLRLLL